MKFVGMCVKLRLFHVSMNLHHILYWFSFINYFHDDFEATQVIFFPGLW